MLTDLASVLRKRVTSCQTNYGKYLPGMEQLEYHSLVWKVDHLEMIPFTDRNLQWPRDVCGKASSKPSWAIPITPE